MAKNYEVLGVICKNKPSKCVYLGNHKTSRNLCAIKTINLENADDCFDDDDFHMLFSELALLKQFNHQNILSLIDCFSHEMQIWCIYPLMHYGTLSDILNSNKREKGLSESAMQIISKSVLSALQYIHSKYIIHRCVCPENIYVTKNGDVLLGGFNFSVTLMNRGSLTRKLFDYPPKIKNYLNYLSPEVLQQNLNGYNTKSDIYSFGVTLCELANGVNPFVGCEAYQMLYEKLVGFDIGLWDCTILTDQSKIKSIDEAYATENPKALDAISRRCFSEIFRNFVDSCVTKNYQSRPDAIELLTHGFLKKISRRNLIEHLEPVQSLNLNATPSEKFDTRIPVISTNVNGADMWDFD